MAGVEPATSTSNGDRLNGWKDIAAHLGKGVRTVQRWERELGLPVHRIKGNAGEILFASAAEIDDWQHKREEAARAEQARPVATSSAGQPEAVAPVDTQAAGDARSESLRVSQPSPAGFRKTHRVTAMAGVALLVCIVGALAWIGLPRLTPRKTPTAPSVGSGLVSWRVSGGRLEALDADKHVLWFYDFPRSLDDARYRTEPEGMRLVAIEDIDGDNRAEVLFVYVPSDQRICGSLYCFGPDGVVRFNHQWAVPVRFGVDTFLPPFRAKGLQIGREMDGRRSIWVVSQHYYDFPAVVEKLDAAGGVLGSYWSNGYIELLAEATMDGRRVMLAGGTNNESVAASLAVIDYDHPSGRAPAVTTKFSFADPAATMPLRFFLFPVTDVCKALGAPPYAIQVVVGAGAAEVITVRCAGIVVSSGAVEARLGYRFDEHFNLVGGQAEESYRWAHSLLRFLPEVNHPFGPRDEQEIAAVREWKDGRFVPVKIGRAGTQGTQ